MTRDVSLDEKKPWTGFELVPLPELKPDVAFFDFQAYSIFHSLQQRIYFLGLPTGVGKTICSIAAFFYYRTVYPDTKLITVTNSSALFQFAAEFDKFFAHSLKIQVLHDTAEGLTGAKYKRVRKQVISDWGSVETPHVLVMNYPIFRIEKDILLDSVKNLKKRGFRSFVIYDEATNFASGQTQIGKAVASLSPHFDKILGLTATLLKGRLDQIYMIFKNVGISLCETKKRFEDCYCIIWQHPKIFYLRKVRGYKNVALFKEKIDPYSMILRKGDVSASLPPLQIQKRFIPISPEQNSLLKEIYSGIVALTPDGIDVTDIESKGQKLLEQLSEVGYIKRTLQSPEVVAPQRFTEVSPKTAELLRFLDEDMIDEKIIVYTPSKKYLHILRDAIRTSEVDPYYKYPLEISGDVPPDVRFQSVTDFTTGNKHNVMLLDDAGSEAMNLQAASVMVVTSLPDSWGKLVQLVGRFSRIGSKNKNLLLIFLLHEDSQDFDEYCILQRQGVLFQAIHGETEKGLLDTSVLRSVEHEGVSDEEFVSRSVMNLLIGTRKRRAEKYL